MWDFLWQKISGRVILIFMDETQNNNLGGSTNLPATPITEPSSGVVSTSPAKVVEEKKLESTDTITPPVIEVKPVEATFSAPVMNIASTPAEKELADKLERAKLAMEGPTRTAAREEREHELDTKNKLAKLDAKLTEIAKQKEVLEITWIKLDENRTGLRKMIDPIVERETKLEVDESQLEEQEKNTVGEKERMTLEQKRWAIQEARHKAEEEKWVYDNRLFKIEDQIKDNTSAYQKILDEETTLLTEREAVEKSAV